VEPADGCDIAGDQLRFNPCMTERSLIERPKFRRTDDKDVYLVYTRWRSQEDFDNWVASPAFTHGHRAHNTDGPVSSHSELWSFDVVQHEEPTQS